MNRFMLRHCMGINHLKGFFLIELLIVLLIIALGATSVVNHFSDVVQNNHSDRVARDLAGILNRARIYALEYGEAVVVCGMNVKSIVQGETGSCSNDWSFGVVAFIDLNQDTKLSKSEDLLEVGDFIKSLPGVKILKNQSTIEAFSYRPTGPLSQFNGSVFYCPNTKEIQFRRSVVVNSAGRSQIEKGEGVSGLPAGCVFNLGRK